MVYTFNQFILYLFANILNSEECNILPYIESKSYSNYPYLLLDSYAFSSIILGIDCVSLSTWPSWFN